MILDGTPYAPRGPRDARARGVAMIYQELALASHLTVESNIMWARSTSGQDSGCRRNRRKVIEVLGLLEHPDIHPETRVRDLGVGAEQLVEVASGWSQMPV